MAYEDFKDLARGTTSDKFLRSKFNKGIKFLLCVIDLFGKYTWVVPLKEGRTIVNAFQSIFNDSKRKSNKL